MSDFGQKTDRKREAIATATSKLEKLIVDHAKPGQFGKAVVEVQIEDGQPVRLVETWSGSSKV